MVDIEVPSRLRDAFAALTIACARDPRIRAAWVGGSLARGTADDWSDIDLHLLVDDSAAFCDGIEDWITAILPKALLDPIPGVPGGYLYITPDWVHVDLIVHATQGFVQGELPVRVVHDPDQLVREVAARPDEMQGEPYLPIAQVKLYLYFMGVAVTVIKRAEWVACRQGVTGFRDNLLIPLMLAENGIRKSDGAKRLNRYLTAEQIAALDAVTPTGSDPEDLVAAHIALAADYLARARRLAQHSEEPWPSALEQATLDLWERELGRRV